VSTAASETIPATRVGVADRAPFLHVGLLFGLALLLLMLDLGTPALTDRDEGSNAEAAREMLESGDWISPTLNGEPRFAKPALVYWLMAGAYKLFGVSEVTARLPSATFAVGLVFLQYGFLARVLGAQTGLLGALMLLLNPEFVAIGRMALTDSVLSFFTTLALFGFWLGLHGEGRTRQAIWLFYIGMGLATLTKGPVGFLIPLLAVVSYLSITHRWEQMWREGKPVFGLLVFVAVALPWYAAMLALHGSRYTASAQADTIGRFLNVIGGHGGTLFFYVPVLLFGFFPWSGLLPFALYQAFKAWREASLVKRKDPDAQPIPSRFTLHASRSSNELELFAALWLVAGFIFFSLSSTRLPHYIVPLFPAAAILTSGYWARCVADDRTPGRRAAIHVTMALGYVFGLALAFGPTLYTHFVEKIAKEFPMAPLVDIGQSPLVLAGVLIVGAAAIGYFGLSVDRRAGAFWAAGATIGTLLLLLIHLTLPRFSHYFIEPPQQLAYAAGLNLAPEERLILYGPPRPSLIFYAKRKAILIRPGEEEMMRSHVRQAGRIMIVMPTRLKPNLPTETAGYVTLLERYGYSLLASQPMVKGLPETPPSPRQLDPSKDPHARYKS
jgi:4-amino-4-deoxy-L-arabinose transferase-like glycosyltransferase